MVIVCHPKADIVGMRMVKGRTDRAERRRPDVVKASLRSLEWVFACCYSSVSVFFKKKDPLMKTTKSDNIISK